MKVLKVRRKGFAMIFDTHTHYDDNQFDIDREQLLLGMKEAGVGTIVNVGATMEGAKKSVAMAKQYPFVYASVGIHPDCTKDLNEQQFEVLRTLAKEEKVVAIGEIGLDYRGDPLGISRCKAVDSNIQQKDIEENKFNDNEGDEREILWWLNLLVDLLVTLVTF